MHCRLVSDNDVTLSIEYALKDVVGIHENFRVNFTARKTMRSKRRTRGHDFRS